MKFKEDRRTIIICDNQGAIALAKNPIYHVKTKCINIQHYFVQEDVDKGIIILEYCPIENMMAHKLTKALVKDRHEKSTKLVRFGKRCPFAKWER